MKKDISRQRRLSSVIIRLPERQLETKYDLCLEQICSQDGELACWDAFVFSFLRPGTSANWFGHVRPCCYCCPLPDPFVKLFEGASGLAERTCH